MRRPSVRTLVASFSPAAVGPRPGRFRWQAISRGRGCAGACAERLPARPAAALLPPRVPIGCDVGGPAFRLNGPRARREVALTFDDGPSPYTPGFLGVLERMHAPATFFLLGNQIAGREALVRRMLADGDMVGDHTWDHADVSGDGPHAAWEMSSTRAAIRRASGFTACLFRAPYGAVSAALIGEARRLAFTTIQWGVDPRDWSLPGAGAIYARDVSGARPGSIIISHDGGGPRGQTLAALPRVIATLRRRGYKLVTVTDLLGLGLRQRD